MRQRRKPFECPPGWFLEPVFAWWPNWASELPADPKLTSLQASARGQAGREASTMASGIGWAPLNLAGSRPQ